MKPCFRNGKAVWLVKEWAKLHQVKVTWIFTETSHGKGPADPVSETNVMTGLPHSRQITKEAIKGFS